MVQMDTLMLFGTTPTSSPPFHLVFLGCWPGAAGLVLKTVSPKQWLPLKTSPVAEDC